MITFTLTPQLIGYAILSIFGLSFLSAFIYSFTAKANQASHPMWAISRLFGFILLVFFSIAEIVALCNGYWFFWQMP